MIVNALQRLKLWIVTSPRWLLVCRMPEASPGLTVAVAICLLVAAALPNGFTLAAGAVVGAVPELVAEGPSSPAWDHAMLALVALGLVFLAQQIVLWLTVALAEGLGRRVLGSHARRVMRATMRPAGLGHLEQPAYLDQIERSLSIHWVSPHAAITAMIQDGTRRIQAVVAMALVGYFYWWLPILLLIALLHSSWRFGPIRRQIMNMRLGKAQGFRRANYFLDLSLRPEAAKEIHVFGLGDWLVDRYERAWLGAMAELWTARSGLWLTVLLCGLPVVLVELIGFGLASWDAVQGSLGVGELVVLTGALRMSVLLGAIGDADSRIEHGAAGLLPTVELERRLAADPSLNLPGRRPADGLPLQEIRFEQVAFSYPDRRAPVFASLDLTIPAGQSLAIVGENGAGKTTLVKLLARLYDPSAGRITVDGADLREYDAASWQHRVAAIFQDFVHYELPATENVTFGAVEWAGDRALLQDAARRAGALEVVDRLPNGWETVLSRRFTGGADLSGGEWQRFGLARALFAAAAGAGVLVLDEPTAQLDVRAEAAFYDQFFELTRGLTTIVISHRFSTVRRADRIVVIDGGQVVEQGSHDELVAAGGRYAEMFELQATRFVDDETGPDAERLNGARDGLASSAREANADDA